MNVVFLSPHFPPNFYHFCAHLRRLGVNVLGLADEPYGSLRPQLRNTLTEYYRVNNMHNYDQLLRGCGYFTHRYGKIDRIDSHNEYWLDTEARLRTDFNTYGPKLDEIAQMRRKSEMKRAFAEAGVNVARGQVVHTPTEAAAFIDKVGYPVVAKPDSGVGAANTYKISNPEELEQFFVQKPPIDYIVEEFIQGTINTFDGLTNKEGDIVFFMSLRYSRGIMEVVNEDDHIYYYTLRDIPDDLEKAGRKVVKACDIRERFFHIEFFRTDHNRLIALEVNMRPPGGYTLDMFNFANDFDVYAEWANILVHNRFSADCSRPYHCCHVGRKYHKNYAHSHEEILNAYGDKIMNHQPLPDIWSRAMGNYYFLVRSPDLEEILSIAHFIQELH